RQHLIASIQPLDGDIASRRENRGPLLETTSATASPGRMSQDQREQYPEVRPHFHGANLESTQVWCDYNPIGELHQSRAGVSPAQQAYKRKLESKSAIDFAD